MDYGYNEISELLQVPFPFPFPCPFPFPDLFEQQEFEPFNPNPLDLGGKILNNSTRVQLQDACNSGPRIN